MPIVSGFRATLASLFSWTTRKSSFTTVAEDKAPNDAQEVLQRPPLPPKLQTTIGEKALKVLRTVTGEGLFSSTKTTAIATEDNARDDPAPNSTPEHPSERPKSKTLNITEKAQVILKVLGIVASDVPFTGMITLVGGLQFLADQYEKRCDNDEDLGYLLDRLEKLAELIQPYEENRSLLPANFTKLLTVTLQAHVSMNRLLTYRNSSTLSKLLSAASTAKEIVALTKKINDIFNDIVMQLHLQTMKQIGELVPKVDDLQQQWILTSLLKAPNAVLDSLPRSLRPCHAGTRLDVLEQIEDWARADAKDSPQIFCLSGSPGSGKTAIAVSISHILQKDPDIRFAGFFCTSLREDASNSNFIFPTLAAQLAHRQDVFAILKGVPRQQCSIYGRPGKQFKDLLIHSLTKLSGVTLLVIDGLDECKESDDVLEIVDALLQNVAEVPTLKVLVCCRSGSEIFQGIISVACRRFSLDDVEPQNLRHDLRLLFSVELQARNFSLKSIISLMDYMDGANCSFLIAYTACTNEDLSPLDSQETQRDTLGRLMARHMDSTYDTHITNALAKADSNNEGGKERGNSGERNSLSVTDLATLVEVPAEQLSTFFNSFPKTVLETESEKVHIHHSSFQEYVKLGVKTVGGGSSSHLHITHRLIRHMSVRLHHNMSGGEALLSASLLSLNVDGILSYACRYWAKHLEMIGTAANEKDLRELLVVLKKFFLTHLLHWLEVLSVLEDVEIVDSVLKSLIQWTEMHRSYILGDSLSQLNSILLDASNSFEVSKRAIKSSATEVYRTFLLPLTHSGRRLAERYPYVGPSLEITELLSLPFSLEPGSTEPKILLSQDATCFTVVWNGCVGIGDSSKNDCAVFLSKSDSKSYIDALVVGQNQVLITMLRSGLAEVWLWTISEKKPKEPFWEQEYVSESQLLPVLALSADGTLVAISTSSKVRVWDIKSWEERLVLRCRKDQYPQERLLALSPRHILVGLRLRSLNPGASKRIVFHDQPLCAIFSSDGNALAVAGNSRISFYRNLLSNNATSTLSPSVSFNISCPVTSLALSPNARYLAVVGVSFLAVWDTFGSLQPLMKLQNETYKTISSVVFSKDSKYLQCGHICPGEKTVLFDMRAIELPIAAQMRVTALAMSSGRKVATGSDNGAVTLWNRGLSSVLYCWERERHPHAVAFVTFSPNGRLLASISKDRIYVRGTTIPFETYARLIPSGSGDLFLSACSFSGDSSLFLCIVQGGIAEHAASAQIWKTSSWDCDLRHIRSISLSQTGEMLAISTNQCLAVHRINLCESSVSLASSQRFDEDLLRLSFSPDNRYILSTAGVLDIAQNFTPTSTSGIEFSDVYIRDGWFMDLKGEKRCQMRFKDICGWASSGSTLVFFTKTLGNVSVVSVCQRTVR
ncbi:hypothetical protein BT96DRAFT_924559 [Gymnopus androsaceus JB14]|uniref:NACHT domain-containing protein n=1 Tax=Gymnopus androsaceus JB14 TaxID=1447944 RepID=A0A6A4H3I8_9AGAR|nr:hypothetical protein BT96DRAFT_924559 [Gymnopus androsaceus JB14]